MHYPFPSACHLDDYLDAIRGSDEFLVKYDDAGFAVINYVFVCDTTFPSLSDLSGEAHRRAILRRECRGLEFDRSTGEIVTRKYHKFFGINEKPETQVGMIDWTQPHHVLEKADGSMITPYRHKDGGYQWHTRTGLTPAAMLAHRYATEHSAYVAFAEAMREDGKTPIFEWCSPRQRIVIEYPQDRLVLTAVRDLRTGVYEPYRHLEAHARRFGLPLVQSLGIVGDVGDFLRETAGLADAEGYVIRFADGHAVKAKGMWYCRVHNIKDQIKFEKNVWDLVLRNGVDDIRPFLQADDRLAIDAFAAEFHLRLSVMVARLTDTFAQDRRRYRDKRQFAMEGESPPHERGMLFRLWDGHDPWSEVISFLRKNVGSQAQIDKVRSLLNGLSWREFYGSIEE